VPVTSVEFCENLNPTGHDGLEVQAIDGGLLKKTVIRAADVPDPLPHPAAEI
jgi:hypothetical protein